MVVGVVGLGLIGGSMAQAVRANTSHTVLGMDQNAQVEAEALQSKVLDGILNEETLPNCDFLLLALYPQVAVAYMETHAASLKKGACVVDLCGVKRVVSDALVPLSLTHGFHFIGGHPMAGREKSGYAAANPDLFQGASMILTPHDKTPADVLTRTEAFFQALGFGGIRITDEETHDRMIAYTSQLAHVLSNAYIKSPQALRHKGFSAGSFQDLTRVATLNADMWTQLFLDNRDFLTEEIDALCERLAAYSEALKAQDKKALHALLQEGSDWKAKTL
ncbi:MAG: prephenate dehydrogenase [Oscillospiraceae bacterium]|nr:prephenate dehydrogenase [Oscillospiraceae bacterium]